MDTGLTDQERKQMQVMMPLIKRRVVVSFSLSLFLIVLYALYGVLLTGDGVLASVPVWGRMTLVMATSVAMVILGVLAAGIYTWWCRNNLDPKVEKIKKGIQDE